MAKGDLSHFRITSVLHSGDEVEDWSAPPTFSEGRSWDVQVNAVVPLAGGYSVFVARTSNLEASATHRPSASSMLDLARAMTRAERDVLVRALSNPIGSASVGGTLARASASFGPPRGGRKKAAPKGAPTPRRAGEAELQARAVAKVALEQWHKAIADAGCTKPKQVGINVRTDTDLVGIGLDEELVVQLEEQRQRVLDARDEERKLRKARLEAPPVVASEGMETDMLPGPSGQGAMTRGKAVRPSPRGGKGGKRRGR